MSVDSVLTASSHSLDIAALLSGREYTGFLHAHLLQLQQHHHHLYKCILSFSLRDTTMEEAVMKTHTVTMVKSMEMVLTAMPMVGSGLGLVAMPCCCDWLTNPPLISVLLGNVNSRELLPTGMNDDGILIVLEGKV